MKILFVILTSALICISCSTTVNVSQKQIHKSSKFDGSFSIARIKADSFNLSGKPVKYKTDSVFTCQHKWDWSFEELETYIKGSAKEEYSRLLRSYDSLKKEDRSTYRGIDTIVYYSTRYIPEGFKKSKRFYEIEAKLDFLKYRSVKTKYRRTVYFSKHNRSYKWKFGGQEISGVKFLPGVWYVFRTECSYGLLTAGACTFTFSFDEKGELTLFKEDTIYDGPF